MDESMRLRAKEIREREHERLLARTRASHRLYERAVASMPWGVASSFQVGDPYPVYLREGRGSRVWDVDGHEYVDYHGGFGVGAVGHAHPRVVEAIGRAARTGTHFAVTTETTVAFAEELCRRFRLEQVRFTNSGTEANEAAIKLAQLHAYRRCLRRHGAAAWERLMRELGIPRATDLDADAGAPAEPLWADHPLFLLACEGAFHGRTLGVLSLTRSKKAHHIGYSRLPWVRHLPFNGRADDLLQRLDTRGLPALLDAPGGVREVLAAGRVPVDLCALLAVECVQGEGGYRIAERAWLGALAEACRAHGIPLGVDEVQTFARTGELFAAEHYGLAPDIVWTSKGAVVGLTVAREELVRDCHAGWHSNTFGGGKLFDVNLAHAVIDTVANGRDPLFEGRGYLENSRIKGEYVRLRLSDLAARHADVLADFSGLGGMWGLTVRWREEVIRTGWRLGAKLLGCGRRGELSRLRIVLPVDVLTREVDEMVDVLDRVFDAVGRAHEDG